MQAKRRKGNGWDFWTNWLEALEINSRQEGFKRSEQGERRKGSLMARPKHLDVKMMERLEAKKLRRLEGCRQSQGRKC